MKGTTHIVGGVGTALLFQAYTNYGDANSVFFIGTILGSLFPDIDSKGLIAKPGKLLRIRSKATRDTINSIGGFISNIIQKFTEHRGFFHWPVLGIMILLLGYDIDNYFLFYFGLGFLSHCFLDSLNEMGIPILAPFSLKRYHLAKIKYGRIGEKLFLIVFAISIVFLMKDSVKERYHSLSQEDKITYQEND